MGILKTKKNKKFNYSPRYYSSEKEGSPYRMEQKFDQFRKTVGSNRGLKNKFKAAWDDLRDRSDKNANRRILIIIAILVLIFLYLIDFDLSIFTQPN
ncbi:riboflavin synthase subunit beta [Aureitalea marina]|uniref:Riboflavin synthase subunit beta n=1 Tax=Aureitalea marina TaxID=930804 RepID=A0A2S7KPY8_9FLAO|nr:riboflavin synthase subunit beta [Aureitalea marina]PQB04696.1 riboflavin synthase subunit beta [Aureitalea marina]